MKARSSYSFAATTSARATLCSRSWISATGSAQPAPCSARGRVRRPSRSRLDGVVEGRQGTAGEVARPDRRGGQVPAALPRPDSERGKSSHCRHAEQSDQRPAALHGWTRLHGGGDAYARAGPRRWDRAPICHPPQRSRPRPVPANRDGAPPQATHRRRHRKGVRDRARPSATRAST